MDKEKHHMPTGNTYLPSKDNDLAGWLDNYIAIAADNQAALGLTTSDIVQTQAAVTNFEQGISNAFAVHAAAKAATVSKDEARQEVEKIVRAQVKKIQANPAIPNTLRSLLKITVPKPRQKVLPVFAPANAVAAVEAGGIVALTWDANGNAPGVIYMIEVSASAASGWVMVNAQSSTRYLDTPAPGATSVYYRVKARRGKKVSDPSNVVVASAGQSLGTGTEVHLRAVG